METQHVDCWRRRALRCNPENIMEVWIPAGSGCDTTWNIHTQGIYHPHFNLLGDTLKGSRGNSGWSPAVEKLWRSTLRPTGWVVCWVRNRQALAGHTYMLP